MDDVRIDGALDRLERVDDLAHIGDLVDVLSTAPARAAAGVPA